MNTFIKWSFSLITVAIVVVAVFFITRAAFMVAFFCLKIAAFIAAAAFAVWIGCAIFGAVHQKVYAAIRSAALALADRLDPPKVNRRKTF